ncbi:MAG: AAA family ATPase, partial [Alphaproteobacteria bacterium]|nr:AAA family ATPase [Alphaproteobacteria bacterium]
MKLIKLVTTNFKRLGTFTADFTDGLNVICGENARGKSTLIQAIEAALFGVTVVPGKKEHIPTWGQTTFGLELHFSSGDSIYVLTRSKSTAKLLRYGLGDNSEQLVANGNTPVTAYVEELLGLTAKDFALFLNSKQHQTSGLLSFGTTALNQKVEEFAGIALIDSIMTRARAMATAEKAAADAC